MTAYRDLPLPTRRILDRARKANDRELLALGATWLRVFGQRGYPPESTHRYIAAAFKSINGTLTGSAYAPISKYAGAAGDRVYKHGPARGYNEPKTADQCVRIAIEAAAIVSMLAPHYGPDDALFADLIKYSAPWRRVMGDEPLLSLINAPKEATR